MFLPTSVCLRSPRLKPASLFPTGIHVSFDPGRRGVGRPHRAAARMLLRGNRGNALLSHLSSTRTRTSDAAQVEGTDGQVGTQDRGQQGEHAFISNSA